MARYRCITIFLQILFVMGGSLFYAPITYASQPLNEVYSVGTYVTQAQGGFLQPQGLYLTAVNGLYVADTLSGGVKFVPSGGGTASGPVVTAGSVPTDVKIGPVSGRMYIPAFNLARVEYKDPPLSGGTNGNFSVLAGSPWRIATDSAENIYVSLNGGNIVKHTYPGFAQTTLVVGANPVGLAVDSSNNVYAASGGNLIKIVQPANTVSTLFTGGVSSVAVDSSDNVYFSGNNVVRKMTAGGVFSVIGGTAGVPGSTDNNDGAFATFINPNGIAVNSDGSKVYISERDDGGAPANVANRKIRILQRYYVINGSFSGITSTGVSDGGLSGALSKVFTNDLLTNDTSNPFYTVGNQIRQMSPSQQAETMDQLLPDETNPSINQTATAGRLPVMRLQAMRSAADTEVGGEGEEIGGGIGGGTNVSPGGAGAFHEGGRSGFGGGLAPPLSMAAMRGLVRFMTPGRGQDFNGTAFTNSLESKENIALVQEGSLQAIESQMEQTAAASTAHKTDGKLGFWAQPFFATERQKATTTNPTFKTNTGGLILGLDHRFRKSTLIGIAAGTTMTRVTLEGGLGKTKVTGIFMAPYGSFAMGGLSVDLSLLFGINNYHSDRGIPNLGLTARSKHKGFTLAPQVQVGHTFKLKNQFKLEPFVGLGFTYLKEQGYRETGAEPVNLQLNPNTTKILKTEVGVNLTKRLFKDDDKSLKAKVHMSYINRHTFKGNNATFSMIGIDGTFTTQGGRKTQHLFAPGGSVEVATHRGWAFALNYDAQLGRGYISHQVALRIRKRLGDKPQGDGALGSGTAAPMSEGTTASSPMTTPSEVDISELPPQRPIDPVRTPNKSETKRQKSIEIKTA